MAAPRSPDRPATKRVIALLAGLALGAMCLVIGDSRSADTIEGVGRAASLPRLASAAVEPPERVWARRTLGAMTLEQKVGQLFVPYVYGDSADAPDRRNRTTFGVDTPAQVVAKYHLGGVIYFTWTSPLRAPARIAELSNGLQRAATTTGAGVPLLVSTDQENGAIVRIGPPVTPLPTAAQLGRAGSVDAAREAAAISGRELRALGVNHDLAPVADVDVRSNPVLGNRAFSADPAVVAAMTRAQVAGYQESISATVKHFPGHGGTAVDSHDGVPVVEHDRAQWERLDAPPFRAAIEVGVDVVMVGHLVLPKLDASGLPATLSPTLVDGLLRTDLGYDGVVMTDSLEMDGVREVAPDDRIPVLALLAGADLLLMPQNLDVAYASVLAAVRSGELPQQRVDDSVRRVLELKHRRGVVAQPMVDVAAVPSVVGTEANRAAAKRLGGG